MENTEEFVRKLEKQKEKQKKNQQHQGKGHPDQSLPNVQHRKN